MFLLHTFGNDTIDRYPLPYKGKLTKLLCISREVFEKLKKALAEFELKPKLASSNPKTSFRQKPFKKEHPSGSRNNDLKSARDKCIGSFEPSNILNTRNSVFWRLRNLKAWFKEQASYEDLRYIKSY